MGAPSTTNPNDGLPIHETTLSSTPNSALRKHHSRIPKSRKDAFKSFENLVALANDQERWKLEEVGKVGKQLVWRDVGEAPVLLERFRECLEHAGIGGFRE